MSESESKNIEVHIYGKTLNVISTKPAEYVLKIADYVNSVMQEIGHGKMDPAGCSILAAMSIADDLESLKHELNEALEQKRALEETVSKHERLSEEVDSYNGILIEKLDGAISEIGD